MDVTGLGRTVGKDLGEQLVSTVKPWSDFPRTRGMLRRANSGAGGEVAWGLPGRQTGPRGKVSSKGRQLGTSGPIRGGWREAPATDSPVHVSIFYGATRRIQQLR
jgi:hypothetical protein